MLTVLLQVRYHREGQAQGGCTRTREPARHMRCGSGNHNSSNMLRGQHRGYKRAQGGRTNERKASVGGTSECGGVQANTGDGTTSASRYRGCTGGMNMPWGGGVRTNEHKASAGVANERARMLTAAGMVAAGILCGPPPSPFYYYFLVLFFSSFFSYIYI